MSQPIAVGVRISPDPTGAANNSLIVKDERRLSLKVAQTQEFEFERVYPKDTLNDTVYADQILRNVQKAMDGLNLLVMSYGGNGTGKGHTVFGEPWKKKSDGVDKDGVFHKALITLFDLIKQAQASHEFFVTMSVFQVRKSFIVDLLRPSTQTSLEIRDHRTSGAYVDGLCELELKSAEEAHRLLREALGVRAILEQRSRDSASPHTFVDVRVDAKDKSAFAARQALLRFVQFAGSGGMAATADIGLKTLNEVAAGLAARRNPAELPFGQSAVTRLLEMGLCGNSVTTFLACISERESANKDSLRTLQLASYFKSIETRPVVNRNTLAEAISELRGEIQRTRARLNLEQQAPSGLFMQQIDKGLIDHLKSLIQQLQHLKQQTWERRAAQSVEWEAGRVQLLKDEGLGLVLAPVEDEAVPQVLRVQAASQLKDVAKALEDLFACETKIASIKEQMAANRLKAEGAAEQKDNSDPLESTLAALQQSHAQLRAAFDNQRDQFSTTTRTMVRKEQEHSQFLLLSSDTASIDTMAQLLNLRRTIEQGQVADRDLKDAQDQASQDVDALLAREKAPDKLALKVRQQAQEIARLEWERDRWRLSWLEREFRYEAANAHYQEHMFSVFRKYRLHFEDQKHQIESRYRGLVEGAVKDALKLQDQNLRLRQEVEALRKNFASF